MTSVAFAEWNVYASCNSYICRDGGIISRARRGTIFDSLGLYNGQMYIVIMSIKIIKAMKIYKF